MDRNRSKYLNLYDVNSTLLENISERYKEDLKKGVAKKSQPANENIKYKQKIISFQICKLCSSYRRGNMAIGSWMTFVTEKGMNCKDHHWIKEIERY